jgi:hypothetical protein
LAPGNRVPCYRIGHDSFESGLSLASESVLQNQISVVGIGIGPLGSDLPGFVQANPFLWRPFTEAGPVSKGTLLSRMEYASKERTERDTQRHERYLSLWSQMVN